MTPYQGQPQPSRTLCEPGEWHETVAATRDEGFTFFDFLTAVDETTDESDPAFEVVLHLYDLRSEPIRETFVTTRVPDGVDLASLTDLWIGAAWHERETHEMFGLGFAGFEDGAGEGLRPLLLPDGFTGTPLRKSFVLASRASKPWPGAKDPGESKPRTGRRRMTAPGVPDESWGPR